MVVLRVRRLSTRIALATAAVVIMGITVLVSATTGRRAHALPTTVPASDLQALRNLAMNLANANGDPNPINLNSAVSTRAAAMALASPGDSVTSDGSRAVIMVVEHGSFIAYQAKTPPNSPLPTGTELEFDVDLTSLQILDWGVDNANLDLSALGPVTAITP